MSLSIAEMIVKVIAAILLNEDPLIDSSDIASLCATFFRGKDNLSEFKMTTSLRQAQQELCDGIETILAKGAFTVQQQDLLKETILNTLNSANLSSSHIAHLHNDPQKIYSELVTVCCNFNHFSQKEEDYIKRCFRFISSEIVSIISSYATDFSTMNYTEILTEMDKLKRIISESKNEIINSLQSKSNPISGFLSEYMMAIKRNYSYVELFTSKIDFGFAKSYRLELAYIELFLKLHNSQSDQTMTIQDLLRQGNRWLITGAAGCGKTTLLKWMALALATDPSEKKLEILNGYFPIIVTLRKIRSWDRFGIKQAIEQELGEDIQAHSMLTRELNDTGKKLLLLIDGLDEVDEGKRMSLYKWLFELNARREEWVLTENARRLADLRASKKDSSAQLSERDKAKNELIIIMASRPILSSTAIKNFENDLGIKRAYVQPMTLIDVQRFIDYWYKAIGFGRNFNENFLFEKANSLKSRIASQESLSRLAQTPLLCAMICALHYKKDGILPTNKLELYDACSQMLLEERDTLRKVENGEYRQLLNLEYEDKRRILSDLAFWMLECNGALLIDFSAAANRLKAKLSFMQKINKISEEEAKLQSELILNYFIDRGGILHRVGNGKIGFIHKTFQEYFAAYQIYLGEEWNKITLPNRATDAIWRETIILAVSFSNINSAENVINTFLSRSGDRQNDEILAESNSNIRIVYRLLAINCAVAARELRPDTKAEIDKCTKSLIPPKSIEIETALSACGNLVVPLLSYNEAYNEAYLLSCARVLLEIRTRQSLAQMISYLDSRSNKVYEALLSSWGYISRDVLMESGIIPAYIEATFVHCVENINKQVVLEKTAINLLSKVAEYCSYKFAKRPDTYILSETMRTRLNRRMSRIEVLKIQNFVFLKPRKNEAILKILDLFSISSTIAEINVSYEYDLNEIKKMQGVLSQYSGLKSLTIYDVPINLKKDLLESLKTLNVEKINIITKRAT